MLAAQISYEEYCCHKVGNITVDKTDPHREGEIIKECVKGTARDDARCVGSYPPMKWIGIEKDQEHPYGNQQHDTRAKRKVLFLSRKFIGEEHQQQRDEK